MKTLITPDHTAVLGRVKPELVGLLGKAMRRLLLVVHTACWLHSMVQPTVCMTDTVAVEQTTALTAKVTCPGCKTHGRSSLAFCISHNSKALRGLVTIRYG